MVSFKNIINISHEEFYYTAYIIQFRNSISFLLELCQRHITLCAPEVILQVDPNETTKHIQNLCFVFR